ALTGRKFAHEATFTVGAGERVPFVFTWMPSHEAAPEAVDAYRAHLMTEQFWQNWVGRCTYHGRHREAVIRSLITLKALLRTGYTQEALAWRAWLGRAVAGDPSDVQIMYGVAGERRLAEWEAHWLPGYENSVPVRIGNAAVNQRQLDVYGEVIDALTLGGRSGVKSDRHSWSLQRALLKFLEDHWDEPDEGIWEVRGPRRHFVHSKVMAWVAFDRAVQAAEAGMPGPVD